MKRRVDENDCTYRPGVVYEVNKQKGIYHIWLIAMVPILKRISVGTPKIVARRK